MAPLIFLLAGCLWGKGIAACDAYADPIAREECRYDEIKKALADPAALEATLAHVEDPASRDLALYRLARDTPARAAELCGRVTLPATKDRCAKLIGRPHLLGGP